MAATSLVASCGMNSLHKVSYQRFDSLSSAIIAATALPKKVAAGGCLSLANGRYLTSGERRSRSKMDFVVYSRDQVAELITLGIHLPENWPERIPEVLLAIVALFFANKLGPFGKIKDLLEADVSVADRVEEIAEKVAEFVGDFTDRLPEGRQPRQTLEQVKKVVDTIGKTAKKFSYIVHKMYEMEAKPETMLDKASEKKKTTPTDHVEPHSLRFLNFIS